MSFNNYRTSKISTDIKRSKMFRQHDTEIPMGHWHIRPTVYGSWNVTMKAQYVYVQHGVHR